MRFRKLTIRIIYVSLFVWIGVLTGITNSAAQTQAVIPYFECVEPTFTDGQITQYRAYFGYRSTSANTITIQSGLNNFLLPPSAQNRPTTVFLPGYHSRAFSAVYSPPNQITWFLGNLSTVSENGWASYCANGKITYQGKLSASGAAANGVYDLQFALYDSAVGGTVLEIIDKLAVPVVNGVFTVQLDVSEVFNRNNDARFLEIAVRRTGETTPRITLTPRQELTFAPFALKAKTAYDVRLPSTYSSPPAETGCDKQHEYGKLVVAGDTRLYVCTRLVWRYSTLIAP